MNITLHVEHNGQVSAVFSGPGSADITELFGTDTLPTAYSFHGVRDVEHHGAELITAIRKANPDVEVKWADNIAFEFARFAGMVN